MRRHLVLAAVLSALLLTACGQKGPLYLPPEQQPPAPPAAEPADESAQTPNPEQSNAQSNAPANPDSR